MHTIKKVPIQLDKERHLLYDLNALIDLGEALGINLLTREGWEEFAGKKVLNETTGTEEFVPAVPSLRLVRAIVWAGLRHEDETLTERQVGAMLDPANLSPIIEAYQEAWEAQDVAEEADEPAAGPEQIVAGPLLMDPPPEPAVAENAVAQS